MIGTFLARRRVEINYGQAAEESKASQATKDQFNGAVWQRNADAELR